MSKQYATHRGMLQSGDLLAWSGNYTGPTLIRNIIRFFSMSEYSHVGICIRLEDRVYVVEATINSIRLVPLSEKDEFYHIPMNIEWKPGYNEMVTKYVGLTYSWMDAIRAYLGIDVKNDDKWQCAELANDFYKKLGLDFGKNLTPSRLVKQVLRQTNAPIYLVENYE